MPNSASQAMPGSTTSRIRNGTGAKISTAQMKAVGVGCTSSVSLHAQMKAAATSGANANRTTICIVAE